MRRCRGSRCASRRARTSRRCASSSRSTRTPSRRWRSASAVRRARHAGRGGRARGPRARGALLRALVPRARRRVDRWCSGRCGSRGWRSPTCAGEAEQSALLGDVARGRRGGRRHPLGARLALLGGARGGRARCARWLDDEGRRSCAARCSLHAPRYPAAALRLIEDELAAEPDPDQNPAWLPWPRATPGCCCGRRWRCSRTGPSARWPRRCCAGSSRAARSSGCCTGQPCPEEVQLKVRVLFRVVALERPLPVPGARGGRPARARRGGRR